MTLRQRSANPTQHFAGQIRAEAIAYVLAAFVCVFWAWELQHTLGEIEGQKIQAFESFQKQELEKRAEQYRDVFREIYQSARTISLLPMVRSVKGGNRHSENEDVVAEGRLSADTHRTLQQIYSNLQSTVSISEVYYVLDGFRPQAGEVPFFMYDDLIAGVAERELGSAAAFEDIPAEVEDFEYDYYQKQLQWFRENEPVFRFQGALERIPVLISPLMRTCDNAQFLSERHGNDSDTHGMLYTLPVYDLDDLRFKGLISVVLRANVLESILLGVPFIPVTPGDKDRMTIGGWQMPLPSPMLLRNEKYGIEISDRRNALMSKGFEQARAHGGYRWAQIAVDLQTDGRWMLHHALSPDEQVRLGEPFVKAANRALAGRLMLLAGLGLLFAWAFVLHRRWRSDLVWMTEHDALTELPNRRLFFDRLDSGIARAKRSNRKLALLFIDLIDFNAINDTHGHLGGDRLLVAVAQRLREHIRSTDSVLRVPGRPSGSSSVSRLGGDEFTVLLEDVDNGDMVAPVTERILEGLRMPFTIGRDEIEIHMSVGVAVFPDDAESAEQLLLSADSAMKACREDGGGYRLFNEEMRRRAERQHHLSVELQMALAREEFRVVYQPKQRLSNGDIVSLEALLRWNHPTLGVISPLEFIPLLERSGLIVDVGEWVLEQSCLDLRSLHEAGYTDLHVSVNASMRQLRRPDFARMVQQVVALCGVRPDSVIIEVTESMMMENLNEGREVLSALRDSGIKVAIDDFGTGFSSLTYLQHLPVDYLKLDKSFIDGMDGDRGTHIVESVIQLARGLSMTTIAEGIERVEQREHLKRLGCDMIQGYLLSKPIPLSDMREWLTKQRQTVEV